MSKFHEEYATFHKTLLKARQLQGELAKAKQQLPIAEGNHAAELAEAEKAAAAALQHARTIADERLQKCRDELETVERELNRCRRFMRSKQEKLERLLVAEFREADSQGGHNGVEDVENAPEVPA